MDGQRRRVSDVASCLGLIVPEEEEAQTFGLDSQWRMRRANELQVSLNYKTLLSSLAAMVR